MVRLRGFAISLGLAVAACGPGVVDVPQDDTGTTSGGDSSSTGAPATTVPSSTATTDANPDDTTGTEPATTDPTTDASSGEGSTGEPWTEVAEQTYADARCLQDEPAAWIEIYPDEDDGSCAASPETTNVVVIAVQPWDGLGGTFQAGPEGPAYANGTNGLDMLTGSVTIEVSAPWTLDSVTYDLVGDDLMLSGAAELGPCVDPRTASPCE
jgi:hypothetical protein